MNSTADQLTILLRRRMIAAALVFALSAGAAGAEEFPDRPLRFILGFGTGGPTDVLARTLADQLTSTLGQRVVVENRTGASGNIATQAVASADPDGYTFLIGANPLAVNETMFPDLTVKFGRDIVAVAPIGANANVLVVRPSLNAHTVAEFVALARTRADAVSYATVGVGSSSHLAGIAFDSHAHSKMLPVAYRGGGEALKDLLGGRVDAWFAPIPSVLGAIESGQLVALATTGPQHAASLPNLPTLAESGFPGFDMRLWVGVFERVDVPAERSQIIEHAIAQAMASKDMQAVLEKHGITPLLMTRAEFNSFVAAEIARWRGVGVALRN
jgi:tripartite-type tricarboxylate transporter receptor subunit TctC